ncbi:S-adenosyl-L-methionine-dependent methyltransferase [Trametes meyenii]|nr:S-adenosyl-L-methionine-dependent methyltransferase [Trametes meyenii]
MINFSELLATGDILHECVASGTASAFIEDDNSDSDDEDDGSPGVDDVEDIAAGPQRLRLSSILECDAHFVTKSGSAYDVNPRIYLRTQYAWYVLLRPATAYQPFYRTAWRQHQVVQGMLTSLVQDSRAPIDDILDSIHCPPAHNDPTRQVFDDLAVSVLKDDLVTPDLVSYLTRVLDAIHDEHPSLHRRLVHSKTLRCLYPTLATHNPQPPPPTKVLKTPKDIEKVVLQHRNPTCVTPRVGEVAQKLFAMQAIHVADMPVDSDHETPSTSDARRAHADDPKSIQWVESSKSAPRHFCQVDIDGELYSVGDIVMVEPGHDQDRTRARNAQSARAQCPSNDFANTKWFCKICFMFEQQDSEGRLKKYFHAQWLQHASQTLLQEAAHPRVLFWLHECDDQLLECIFSKVNIQEWRLGEVIPPEGIMAEPNRFCVGLTWDSHNCALIETPSDDITRALSRCESSRPCVSCGIASLQDEKESWAFHSQGVISCGGIDYHVHDFIYLHASHHTVGVLDIAQIVQIIHNDDEGVVGVVVVHYGRYDGVLARCEDGSGDVPVQQDNRRLFQSGVTTTVKLKCISGKAYVVCSSSAQEVEAFVQHDDHFYCDLWSEVLSPLSLDDLEVLESPGFEQCHLCCSWAVKVENEKKHLMKTYGPLKGLELFAGAGGLSTGLEMSSCIQTKWAVEFSPSAAKTYQANHPSAIVYNQCSNKLLDHAIQTYKGFPPKPLQSLNSASPSKLPPMPQPGEVDFIFGGPPCQSFSLMNHHRRADDIRSTLVCNMISYVEFYKPTYFLLENVVGMLSYRLGGKQEGNRVVGGIEMGVVKFILGSLTTLGYQVHFKVLQAGQHGAPQGRRRVIFLGARRDAPLPAFPLPQYSFPAPVHNVNLPTGEVLYPITRTSGDAGAHQCAPLACVTVMEAISDLPRFDWIDPHQAPGRTKTTHQEAEEIGDRLADGISRFSACRPKPGDHLPGYGSAVLYPHPPLSRYQSWVRFGNGEAVSYHYTKWCAPGVVERVVNVPIKPNAGHADLPVTLRIPRLFHDDNVYGRPKNDYYSIYGRINGQGQFVTAMTTIAPNAKGGRVIHPNQKRIITIRECARAQGFPDRYKFLSTNKGANDKLADQMRQIGNAVPVPLALALGKEISKALCMLWRQRELQEAEGQARSPEVHSS